MRRSMGKFQPSSTNILLHWLFAPVCMWFWVSNRSACASVPKPKFSIMWLQWGRKQARASGAAATGVGVGFRLNNKDTQKAKTRILGKGACFLNRAVFSPEIKVGPKNEGQTGARYIYYNCVYARGAPKDGFGLRSHWRPIQSGKVVMETTYVGKTKRVMLIETSRKLYRKLAQNPSQFFSRRSSRRFQRNIPPQVPPEARPPLGRIASSASCGTWRRFCGARPRRPAEAPRTRPTTPGALLSEVGCG